MIATGPKKIKHVYFQNLDAARFIAAFGVFALHFSNDLKGTFAGLQDETLFKWIYLFTSKGSLGVNFFFVLSGFLITFLILKEKSDYGKFQLGKFLIRRTLRIWPLYFIIGLIGFGLFPVIFDDYQTSHQASNYFLFLANFDEIWYGSDDSINFLTAPWSVAVEEQFYLFWGIAIFMLLRTKRNFTPVLILFIYILSFYFRWQHWQDEAIIYHHTLSVCQDILTGAFIGYSVFNSAKWIDRIQRLSKPFLIFVYLLGIGLCLAKNKLFDGELIIIERVVLSLFFGFIIIDQIGGKNSLFKLGRFKLFNHLGKISYGIYMYHLVVMYLIWRFIPVQDYGVIAGGILALLLSVIGTYVISFLSYRFVELKFLSLKPKLDT